MFRLQGSIRNEYACSHCRRLVCQDISPVICVGKAESYDGRSRWSLIGSPNGEPNESVCVSRQLEQAQVPEGVNPRNGKWDDGRARISGILIIAYAPNLWLDYYEVRRIRTYQMKGAGKMTWAHDNRSAEQAKSSRLRPSDAQDYLA